MIRRLGDACISVGREARFRRHLASVAPALEGLCRRGRAEPSVLAILAVESFYRPRPLRALEYLAWASLTLLAPRLASGISVGVAQMSVENWAALEMIDSTRFSLARLRRVRAIETNYEACRLYLDARGQLHQSSPEALSGTYAGGRRRHFAVMLRAARAAIPTSP